MMKGRTTYRTILAAIALAAALATPDRLEAQWTQTAGPQGGAITALAGSERAIYAGVFDDIYRYDDPTGRWVRTGSLAPHQLQFTGIGGHRFLLHADELFATVSSGIIRSSDGGATWVASGAVGSIFSGGGSLYSTDGETILRFDGTSDAWEPIGRLPERTGVPTVFGSSAFTTVFYGSEVFRSDDGMRTWRPVELRLPAEGREATAGHGVTFASGGASLYASVGGAEIFRSSDGETWENISRDLPEGLGLMEMRADADELIISTNHGIYRFHGDAWTQLSSRPVREVAFAGERTVVATYGGLAVVEGDERALEPFNGGLIASHASALYGIGGIVLASSPDGLYRSSDKGSSWHQVAEFSTWMQSAYAEAGGTLFTAAGVLYQSSDSGATWRMTGPKYDFEWEGPPYRNDITGVASANGIVYAGAGSYLSGKGASGWASGGVFRTLDRGVTWEEISSNLPHDGFTHAPVGSIVATPEYLLITNARGIYRSTDGGARWQRSTAGLPLGSEYIGHGELFTLGRTHYLRLGYDFYETSDGGVSWRPMAVPLPARHVWTGAGASVVDDRMYVLASVVENDTNFSMRLMRFDGRTWEDVSATVPEGVTFQSLARAGDHIYAGSFRHGIWRTDAQQGPSAVTATSRTLVVGALSVSPAPTRGDVVVRLELREPSSVTLRLFDARGAEVAMLDLGTLDAGSHRPALPLGDLAPGVYRLQAAGSDWTTSTAIVRSE